MANFIKRMFGKKEPEITLGNENAQANTHKAQPTQAELEKKAFCIHDLLPSFVDMDKDPTAEEIVRVAALAETILNLTFKNPIPIEQDPVFNAVFEVNTKVIMECLQSGKLNAGNHEELKQTFESKYPEQVSKEMVELDYWNMRMIEHLVLRKSLAPKPAYNCLAAAYQLVNNISHPSFINPPCVLVVNYAHLLLKFSMLKIANPVAIGDITRVLKEASLWLGFDEGRYYEPKK